MRRLLIDLVGFLVFTVIGSWLLRKIPAKLLDNAVTGWADDQLGDLLGITAPQAATVPQVLWDWGIPAIVAMLAIGGYHLLQKYWASKEARSVAKARRLSRRTGMVIGGYILLFVSMVGAVGALTMISHGPWQEGGEKAQASNEPRVEPPSRPVTPTRWKPPPGSLSWKYQEAKELLDAAREAYSETRKSLAASIAEANSASPDQIILWYCYALINLSEIWAVRPPSNKMEALDLRGFGLKYDTKTISAPIPGNSISFVQLYISKDDLKTAIEKIGALDVKPSWAPDDLLIASLPKPLAPPKEEKKAILVGSARILIDVGMTNAQLIYKSDSIKIATIEQNVMGVMSSGMLVGDFIFYNGDGPFNVYAYDDGQSVFGGIYPVINTSISHNDDHFVKIHFNLLLSMTPLYSTTSRQIQINFYKKEPK